VLTDDEFRVRLADVLIRSGMSRRALSAAMGRDTGYVAALLDPTRPSRARPTPEDLVRASDATGMPLVELFEVLWDIDRARFAAELRGYKSRRSPSTARSTRQPIPQGARRVADSQ
jgi:hypothetical protein